MSTENPLGITKEEVIKIVAGRIYDDICDGDSMADLVKTEVEKRVSQAMQNIAGKSIDAVIEESMKEQLKRLLDAEVNPVNIWGERTGKPTTIREQVAAKMSAFWSELVNDAGNPTSYNGKPRYQVVIKAHIDEAMQKAVKDHAGIIVAELSAALKRDAVKSVSENIDRWIKVPTK